MEEQAELVPGRDEDRMIPPPAQRAMATRAGATVIEAPGSHSVYVSQPRRGCWTDPEGGGRRRSAHALNCGDVTP